MSNATTTECTGNITRMVTIKDVATDSNTYRWVTVDITRCTNCPGSAFVTDEAGNRWKLDLPADFGDDTIAAYWAAEASSYRAPFYTPEVEEEVVTYEDDQEQEYIEDEDGSETYARMLERKAENGSWFGYDNDGGY